MTRHTAGELGEHVHEPLIQSTLTVTTPDLKIGYDLAEDVQASEDGLTWQVKIRDDVRFTDGEPLTAEDVAFTYNTLKDTSSVNDFTMLKEAVAVDDTTVEFHMNRPLLHLALYHGHHRDRAGTRLWPGLRTEAHWLRTIYFKAIGTRGSR